MKHEALEQMNQHPTWNNDAVPAPEAKFLVFRGEVEEFHRLKDAEERAAELTETSRVSHTVLRVDGDWKSQGLRVQYRGVVARALDEDS